MTEQVKVCLKKGIINSILILCLYLGVPFIFISWTESGQFFGYLFKFAEAFKIALIISGILLALCMFFYSYWPYNSRKSLAAGFLGALVVTLFFINFVLCGITDYGNDFIFTSETITISFSQPTLLILIGTLLAVICLFSCLRILKLKPMKERLDIFLRDQKPSIRQELIQYIIMGLGFVVLFSYLAWF